MCACILTKTFCCIFFRLLKPVVATPFLMPLNPISLLGASEVATFPRLCGGCHHVELGEAPFTIDVCVLRQCITDFLSPVQMASSLKFGQSYHCK